MSKLTPEGIENKVQLAKVLRPDREEIVKLLSPGLLRRGDALNGIGELVEDDSYLFLTKAHKEKIADQILALFPVRYRPDMTREEASEIVKGAFGSRPDLPSGKDFVDEVRGHDRPDRGEIADVIGDLYVGKHKWHNRSDFTDRYEFEPLVFDCADQISALFDGIRKDEREKAIQSVINYLKSELATQNKRTAGKAKLVARLNTVEATVIKTIINALEEWQALKQKYLNGGE